MANRKKQKRKSKLNTYSLLVGIDLNDDYTHISYWDVNENKAKTFKLEEGLISSAIPTILMYDSNVNMWYVGEKALEEYNIENKKQYFFRNFINKTSRNYTVDNKIYSHIEILSVFLENCLSCIVKQKKDYIIESIMISIVKPDKEMIEKIYYAFDLLGYDNSTIQIQRHDESFIQFLINYDKNQREVALYDLENSSFNYFQIECKGDLNYYEIMLQQKEFSNGLIGQYIEIRILNYIKKLYKKQTNKINIDIEEEKELEICYIKNRNYMVSQFINGKSAIIKILSYTFKINFQEIYGVLHDYDVSFKELNDNIFRINMVSYVYISGTGFALPWAKQSLQSLCSFKKVFQSQHLYCKGACYSLAYEYDLLDLGEVKVNDYSHIINNDYGIIACKNGKEGFYPIIKSGKSWYNTNNKTAVIVDNKDSISIYERNSEGSILELDEIKLDNLPNRPNKTIKLLLNFRFVSENQLEIVVKDLGFGKLFPKTDKKWNKILNI